MIAPVRELPLNGFAPDNASIAKHLREQADWLEAPDAVEVSTVFLVFEDADGKIRRQTAGRPCDLGRALGVLAMAIIQSAVK